MSDALVIWDARFNNVELEQFIEQFMSELARFSLSTRLVALSDSHKPDAGEIKPSLRGLFNLVQEEQPFQLITFGEKANSLGALLTPTLKCELKCNRLPSWLDSDLACSSTVSRLSGWMAKETVWGAAGDMPDFICPVSGNVAAQSVLVLQDDLSMGAIIAQLQLDGIDYGTMSKNRFLTSIDRPEAGLLVVSAELVFQDNGIVEQANANGMPVVLVSPQNRHFGINEGINGWVVRDVQEIQFHVCLNNWQSMTQDARNMIAHYCRTTQSSRSGMHSYCESLGYPERLEYKDFKIRG